MKKKVFINFANCFLLWGYLSYLLACRDSYQIIQTNKEEAQEALIYLQDFQHQEVNAQGVSDWVLNAKKANFFQTNVSSNFQRLLVYGLHFVQYKSGSKEIDFELQSQKGELDNQKKLLYLTGKTLYKDSQKRIIHASKMEYDLNSRFLQSDGRVWLEEDGVTTLCRKGIELYLGASQQICKSPHIYGTNLLERKTFKGVFQ